MKKIAKALGALFVLLLAVMVVRTLRLPDRQLREALQAVVLDEDAAARRLAGAIRFKTISYPDPKAMDGSAFKGLHAYLESAFPAAHRVLKKEVVGEWSLLYRWAGRNPALKPIILMSHLDVVPVEPGTERLWQHPPFSGDLADGCIWGRGAIDVKWSTTALLEAAEHLIASGFTPERDLYFAFGQDEEVLGPRGAAKIVECLASRGVQAEFILDEGACITEGLVPGLAKPVALIGLAEKGYLTLRLTAASSGGHSSMPPPRTAIGVLARGLVALERHPFPTTLTPQVREMLECLAPHLPWANRLVMANLWLTRGIVTTLMANSPAAAASLRTTLAPTMLSGSPKENVLAAQATALVNLRILPGDTIEGAVAHVRSVLRHEPITIEVLPGSLEPSPVSPTQAPAYRALQKTLAQVFPGVLAAPGLVLGGTDASHYVRLSPCIYRFMPIRLNPESIQLAHGANERLPIKDYANAVRYYIQLVRNAQALPES